MRNAITMTALGLSITVLAGCMTPEQEAHAAVLQAKAQTVRFVPASKVEGCTYIDQVSVTQDLSILGGQAGMEAGAKRKLQNRAAGKNADSIHISDRQLDKGRGGYDKTRLTLYGDLYKCADEAAEGQ